MPDFLLLKRLYGVEVFFFFRSNVLLQESEAPVLFLELIFTIYLTKGTRQIDERLLPIDPWKLPDIKPEGEHITFTSSHSVVQTHD